MSIRPPSISGCLGIPAGLWAGCCVLTLAAALALGCGRAAPERSADGRLILHYWEKWTGFEGEAMQAVVDDYNASQDRVFVQLLTVSELHRKLLLATAGKDPPDVSGLMSHLVPVYAEKGALLPLDVPLREAGIGPEDYLPAFWEHCTHRGFTWALPTTPATMALHWNKRLFREAGLDPDQPPRSLAELEEMAEQLTVVDVVRDGAPLRLRYPELTSEEKAATAFEIVQLGHLPSEPGWWNTMWGYWFGADLVDGDHTITADSEENRAAVEWYSHYPRKYGLENIRGFGASFGNFSSPQNAFLSEQVAMEIQGVWMYNFIEKYAPHLEWGAAPFPSVNPERLPNVTVAECDVLVIPKGTRHPREAFEFIRYVNSRAAMEKLNLGQRKFTPLVEVSDRFISDHPNPYIEVFMDLARSPLARRTPALSLWTEYQTELSVAYNSAYQQATSPEEALEVAQERAQWRLDRLARRWERVKAQRTEQWSRHDPW